MTDRLRGWRDYARVALAGIRLFNGMAALLAPGWLVRRVGLDPATNPIAFYVFRMFGIRTVLLGARLLRAGDGRPAQAQRADILIHASDTLAAVLAAGRGQIPRSAARLTILISLINTLLAIVAQPPADQRQEPGAPEEGHDSGAVLDMTRLEQLSQEELDDLFRRSPAGPIPQGEGAGRAIIAPGTELSEIAARVIHLLAWQGKVFDPDKGELRNEILPIGIRAVVAKVYKEASWFDGQDCIVLDYSRTSLLAHWIRDEIREIAPGVYLGIVFWDRAKLINFALTFPVSDRAA